MSSYQPCYFVKNSSGVHLLAAHHAPEVAPVVLADLRRVFGKVRVVAKPVEIQVEPLEDEIDGEQVNRLG